jgi:hypothetical protein
MNANLLCKALFSIIVRYAKKSWERCSAAQPLFIFAGCVAPQSSPKSVTKLGSEVTNNR